MRCTPKSDLVALKKVHMLPYCNKSLTHNATDFSSYLYQEKSSYTTEKHATKTVLSRTDDHKALDCCD